MMRTVLIWAQGPPWSRFVWGLLATIAGTAALTTALMVASAPTPAPTLGPRYDLRCGGFDFPVGPPNASGYYDAQPFGTNEHLGSDWNGNGGGDTDRGDPVHAIAHGDVTFAEDIGGGWGNVVRIVHTCDGVVVESLYAHLDVITVVAGAHVERGAVLGTIGDAGGQYVPHLHFELRATPGLPIGAGYGTNIAGHLDPTAFIRDHRP